MTCTYEKLAQTCDLSVSDKPTQTQVSPASGFFEFTWLGSDKSVVYYWYNPNSGFNGSDNFTCSNASEGIHRQMSFTHYQWQQLTEPGAMTPALHGAIYGG
ncbi:hypothetical protein [Actinomycetospora chiangmaiensis]|uniref:hypothetical protein n=1 Tax=Actinomycetospora chiangmaiensis TaxID=402650 RepID=UPI0012F89A57|nr:hypothetical protein [Actinomycetospora chiangmaiensis]